MGRKAALVFDVDGTLTLPRQGITMEMENFLISKKDEFYICVVSGSNEVKIFEQIRKEKVFDICDYLFAENGLVGYKNGQLISKMSLMDSIGEDGLQDFINFTLCYLSELKLPFKRGTFIEVRNAMLNISPVGRGCSVEERNIFEKYDQHHKIRATMIDVLKAKFEDLHLQFSIGGQISFDVFPIGWDKRYCLELLAKDEISDIHFFGDKTSPGGNDYEIYSDSRVKGHSVKNPQDTMKQVEEVCNSYMNE